MAAPLSAAQLAAALGVTVDTVNGLARDGRIPFYQVGRKRLFDLERVLAATEQPARPRRVAAIAARASDDFSEIRRIIGCGPGARKAR